MRGDPCIKSTEEPNGENTIVSNQFRTAGRCRQFSNLPASLNLLEITSHDDA